MSLLRVLVLALFSLVRLVVNVAVAGPCDAPVNTDTAWIIKPAADSPLIRGAVDFQVNLSLPSGPPVSVEVWVNGNLRATFPFDQLKLTQVVGSNNQYVLRATFGETDDSQIRDDPGLNRIEVVEHGPKGCVISHPALEVNGIDRRSRALVVGISNYPNIATKLSFAHQDAHLMAQYFKTQLHVEDVRELPEGAATQRRIRAELDDARLHLSPDSRFYLYFSGHGYAKDDPNYDISRFDGRPQDQVYIVPWEGEIDDPWTLVPVTDIVAFFNHVQASTKVLIFDACFAAVAPDSNDRWRSKGVFDARESLRKATGAAPIADITVGSRILAVLSTRPGGVSYEAEDAATGGVFTHFLLQAAADKVTFPSGTTLSEAAKYAKDKGDGLLKGLVTGYGTAGHEDLSEVPTVFGASSVGSPIPWSDP